MRKAYYFILPVVVLFLMISCGENTSQDNNVSEKSEELDTALKEPVVVQEGDTKIISRDTGSKVSAELFQNKITMSGKDSILSYKTVRSADKNCINWSIPPKSELIKIITTFYEISGNDWNSCYGDWSCGVEGQILFQSKKYNYRLDAGGWVILFDKKEQRYFGCKNPDCKKYFPSPSFCNEDGIIDE